MSRSGRGFALACLVALVSASAPRAHAQTSIEQAMKACATESDDRRRLACYDHSLGRHAVVKSRHSVPGPAATPPAPVAPSTVETPSAAAPATGAGAASADEFGKRNGPLDERRHDSGPREITAAVTRIDQRAGGLLVISLDNGQTWIQNQVTGEFPLKAGDVVRIRAAALGSYMLLAPSKRFTRVTRIH